MFLLPEFSYIAVPGFIPRMRGQRHKTSSLILHNTNDYKWDYFLRQGDSFLMSWLHDKTGFIHNIYFPYAPDNRFLDGDNQHIIDIIQPAITRIKNFLLRYEVEDVEEYMNDSEEWLSILFSFGPHHYKAAKIACSCFGIQIDEFPVILLWSNLENTSLIKIIPNLINDEIERSLQIIYSAIVNATENLDNFQNIPIDRLIKEVNNELLQGFRRNILNEINPIKSMEIIRTQQTIARTLENIGNLYKDEFNEAILNFEDKFINDSHQALSMRRITDESTIEMQRLLTRKGFSLIRQGNNHEIWKHPNLKKVTSLPRHKKLSTFVIASIQKDIEDAIQ